MFFCILLLNTDLFPLKSQVLMFSILYGITNFTFLNLLQHHLNETVHSLVHSSPVPPQVGNGRFWLRRWQIAAMWWRIYPEEHLMYSGWAASPTQEQDLSVMLQHLLLWLLILKARTILSNIMLNVCCWTCVIPFIHFSHFHSFCISDRALQKVIAGICPTCLTFWCADLQQLYAHEVGPIFINFLIICNRIC